MTKIFNSIFLDLQHKQIPNYKLNKLINRFSKKNINVIIYNNLDVKISNYKVYIIDDSKKIDKIKFLMEGFYSSVLYIKVDLDKFGNLLFFNKDELISEKQLFEYNFIPSLQSAITDKTIYVGKMANIIKNTEQKRKKILKKYDKKIRKKFCKYYSNNDIFDKITGGIHFKDYEWELLRDTNLKKIFEEQVDNSFLYLIDTEHTKLLRGSDTYYYLLANKGKYNDVTLNNINEWNENNIIFLKKCHKCLGDFYIENFLDRKLILGLLDNIRGYNLQMLNLYTLFLFNPDSDNTFCVNITDNKKYEKINRIIDETNKLLINTLFSDVDIRKISNLLNDIIYIFPQIIKKINKFNGTFFYNKGLKSHREADCFIENYIAISEYKNSISRKKVNLITLLYGGIEIPMLVKSVIKTEIAVYLFSIEGIYKERHIRSDDKKNKCFKQLISIKKNDYNILCDDNILTGKTIELAMKILFDNNCNIDEIFIVRHPDVNRLEHIWDSKNYIDIELFSKLIKGGLFDSNYSKVKENTNYGNTYLDEFGVFDISKDYICRLLYKNGRFSKESRINEYNTYFSREEIK